jgi:4-amino-4-deoxy-L-arabinose transferase-like glycosyltransferase
MLNGIQKWVADLRWIFLVSLLLHVAIVFAVGHYQNARLWENGGIADHLWEGRGFAGGFSKGAEEPTSWQAPGYPYLLLASWKVWGHRSPAAHLAISLLQALAIASMVVPLHHLTRRWFGPQAALWAAWITVLMPLYGWYPTRLHHTAFVFAFHPWLVWGWLEARDRKSLPGLLAAGAGTGLAGLFQPVVLAVMGPLTAALVLRHLGARQWKGAAWVIAGGMVTLAVLTPWTLRNHEVHGKWMLVKNSFGKEFWMGNNPHATGTGYTANGVEEITNAFPPRAFELRGRVSEMALMEALQQEAWEHVRAHPGDTLRLTLKKIAWFWTLPDKRFVRATGDAEALVFRWVHFGYWMVFVLLTAWTLLKVRPIPCEYVSLALFYGVLFSLIYGLTHVGQARFRGEMEFIFIPAIAAALAHLSTPILQWFVKRADCKYKGFPPPEVDGRSVGGIS